MFVLLWKVAHCSNSLKSCEMNGNNIVQNSLTIHVWGGSCLALSTTDHFLDLLSCQHWKWVDYMCCRVLNVLKQHSWYWQASTLSMKKIAKSSALVFFSPTQLLFWFFSPFNSCFLFVYLHRCRFYLVPYNTSLNLYHLHLYLLV